jgi:aromatic ring-opening dioxygenase catalytic subunit (LigB family)
MTQENSSNATASRQPAIYLPHGGGPCFFMDWSWGLADTWKATQRFLEGLAATLPEPPKALLVVSAHWEEPAFTVGAAARPELIYDYYQRENPRLCRGGSNSLTIPGVCLSALLNE